jgi:hypothetical protein
MPFYPILQAPGCLGSTTLFNFPPNNWEDTRRERRLIRVTWAEGETWRSETVDELAYGDARAISQSDLEACLSVDALPLLSLGSFALPARSEVLPTIHSGSEVPAWRATLSLFSPIASTCYQGELEPFPVPGSLLTFAPFIQFGADVENYMLLLNLEKRPRARKSSIEIYDSAQPELPKSTFEVCNNNISVIRLDNMGFGPDDLPAVVCKSMSGIPLYFSKTVDGACLSLEHTHPPASHVIHGKRFEAQKILKRGWFAKLGRT